ncbi:ATP-dependent Clp protease adapter protein CLPS2, chloroplastic-like protein [Drosera capensis]
MSMISMATAASSPLIQVPHARILAPMMLRRRGVGVVCVAGIGRRGGLRGGGVCGVHGGGGAGVIEMPPFKELEVGVPGEEEEEGKPRIGVLEPSPLPLQEGGDMGILKDKKNTGSGDSYRVLLLDDESHTAKLVAKVLPRAVPSVSPDEAKRIFHESREKGAAVVIVAVKEHAEFYSQMMNQGGLRSSIEPDSDTV